MPVDFLICGTQKGGTSALDAYCRCHPDLLMPIQKELHFFDNDALFGGADVDYRVYHAQFPENETGKYRGESTPVYMYWPGAAARIRHYNQAMKLVVLLRNPVDRAYSHWQMEYSRGYETLPFSIAIRSEGERLAEADVEYRRVYSYIDRGRYLQQLRTLWSLFGKDQVLVLQSDQLRGRPDRVLARLADFLGISPFPPLQQLNVNSQSYPQPVAAEDRAYLNTLFADEITALESELDWDLSDWR